MIMLTGMSFLIFALVVGLIGFCCYEVLYKYPGWMRAYLLTITISAIIGTIICGVGLGNAGFFILVVGEISLLFGI